MYYTKKIPEPFGTPSKRTATVSIPIETAEKPTKPLTVKQNRFSSLAVLFLLDNILKKGDE